MDNSKKFQSVNAENCHNSPVFQKTLARLEALLNANSNKRVVVLGTTCSGKTTLLKYISSAVDMDKLIFPLLNKEEAEYVCQEPWTEEIGKTMNRFVREKIKVQAGTPVFGTVLMDCDLVVYLKLDDNLLLSRTASRGVSFNDAKNMQAQIESEILKSGIDCTEFLMDEA